MYYHSLLTKMRPILTIMGVVSLTLTFSTLANAQTVVTTYIVKKQEERKSTRFTLTEWLRIKERMKMMDLWLAMFSEPKKETFSPELMFLYGQQGGNEALKGVLQAPVQSVDLDDITYTATYGRLQLWLTNIISGTFGVRTLNIDIGYEGYLNQHTMEYPSLEIAANEVTPASRTFSESEEKGFSRYNAGALRIFGKNIQDSSLVLKFGDYQIQHPAMNFLNKGSAGVMKGTASGGELQLYLSRWLGFEGNYMKWSEASSGNFKAEGSQIDYGVYIEISLFRLMGGFFQESWTYKNDPQEITSERSGMYTGLKLNF